MFNKLLLLLLINGLVAADPATGVSRFKRQVKVSIEEDNRIIEVFNNCRCVFHYQCRPNNTVVTNGENLIDIRINENPSYDKRNETLICKGGKFDGEIICCGTNSITTTNDTSTNPRSPDVIIDAPDTSNPSKHMCGTQRTKINVRISTDDENSIDGEFPWIAAIYKKKKNGNRWDFHCSGTLINPKVILTANHYFHRKNPEDFKVILNGNIELPKLGNDIEHERNLIEIVHHPQYYGGALYNDAALLILDKPMESSKTNSINSICLPPDEVIDSGRCLVAGWGKGSEEDGIPILKKVEVPLLNFNRCQNLLRKTRLGASFDLHNSFMCAGGEKDRDACKGDGGSPLMCTLPSSNRYYHAGIVSWGIGCGQEDVPGVYASTTKMKNWILEELRKRNIQD